MFFPHESFRRIFLRSSQRISSYSILFPANMTGHFRMWEMHSCSTLNSPLNDLKYGKGPEFILKEICSVSYPLKMPMLLATCENRWNMKHFGLFLKLTLYSWSLCIAFFLFFMKSALARLFITLPNILWINRINVLLSECLRRIFFSSSYQLDDIHWVNQFVDFPSEQPGIDLPKRILPD